MGIVGVSVSVAEGRGLLGNLSVRFLGALCVPLWSKCSALLLDKPAHKDRSSVQQTGMESPCVPTAGLHQSAQRDPWVLESTGFNSQPIHLSYILSKYICWSLLLSERGQNVFVYICK